MSKIEEKLSEHDLQQVRQCGAEMNEISNGQIDISSVPRQPLASKSPALLEHQKQQEKEEQQGRG